MSAAISFAPKHAQPFTLEQAMALEIDMLVAEIPRLENSIAHLSKTQDELRSFIAEDPENDEDGVLNGALKENDQVISSQRERISLIKVALMNKVGEGGMRHMGLLEPEDDIPRTKEVSTQPGGNQSESQSRIATNSANNGAEPASRQEEALDEGMYL